MLLVLERRPRRARRLRERAVQRRRRARAAAARRRAGGATRARARARCAARRSRRSATPTRSSRARAAAATASRRRCSTPPPTAPARRWPRSFAPSGACDHAFRPHPDLRPDRRGAARQRRQDDPQAGRLAPARADQHARARRAGSSTTCAGCATASCTCAPSEAYAPILHFDVYGLLGEDAERVILELAEVARPFALRVEHPFDAGSRDAQIARMAALRERARAAAVAIVADEWANTRRGHPRLQRRGRRRRRPDQGARPRLRRAHRRRGARLQGARRGRARRRLVHARPSARRRSPSTSRSAPTPTSSWPSPGWASTKACKSCATRWRERSH